MILVTQAEALAHCRADAADAPNIAVYGDAAEDSIAQFLNRRVFVDQTALTAARTQAAIDEAAAYAAFKAAIEAAGDLEDAFDREQAIVSATRTWRAAQWNFLAINDGMVVTPAIKAAVLLRLGDLYRNREERIDAKIQLSSAIEALLLPYRVGWGV